LENEDWLSSARGKENVNAFQELENRLFAKYNV
jgi:hypothetical protein